jgi:hypothetical protein
MSAARLLACAVLRAADWLLRPPPSPTVPLFDLMDAPTGAPHPQPCIEPVWALHREPGDPLAFSLVPTADGRMALFAADLDDFVAAKLERADVQDLFRALQRYLRDTAAVIR